MKIVSPFLKRVVYPSLSAVGVFRRGSACGLAVVTYHGVLPSGYAPIDGAFDGNLVTSEMLRRQLRMLKDSYNVISPEEVLAWREGRHKLPPRAVLITCDDGLLNNLTDMLPVLEEEGVQCLFFVTGASVEEQRTGLWYEELFLLFHRAPAGLRFEIVSDGVAIQGELGSREERRCWWWNAVKRLSQIDGERRASFMQAARRELRLGRILNFDGDDAAMTRRFGLMNGTELREVVSKGMTIGAHTLSHPMLSQTPAELVHAEIAGSRTRLEGCLRQRVWAFAYPFGDAQSVTEEVLEVPRQAGFAAAFLNFGGGLGTDLPAYALPRVHVTAEMGLAELEAHVSGFYAGLRRRVA